MLGFEMRLMKTRSCRRRMLAIMVLLLLSSNALAVVQTKRGPQLNDVARSEPTGLTSLLQSPCRVGSISGQGGGIYFYRCGAQGLNALLAAYAKVDMEQREVFIWPSLDEFKTSQGTALDNPPARYNAVLIHPDRFAGSGRDGNETLHPIRPRLTIYISDLGVLEKLRFSPGLDIVHPAQRLADVTEAIYEKYLRYRAIRFLRDLGPDAEPLREHLEKSLDGDNEYVVKARKSALERLQPNEDFRKISDRVMRILQKDDPNIESQNGQR